MMDALEGLMRDRRIPHCQGMSCPPVLDAGHIFFILIAVNYTESDHEADRLPKQGAITHACIVVRSVQILGVRRAEFLQYVIATRTRSLQLLRDVRNHWGFTLLMLMRMYYLKEFQALQLFISEKPDYAIDGLHEAEWLAIDDLIKVLLPAHAFQQRLSYEKTPTLCDYLPSFQMVIDKWRDLKQEVPLLDQEGIIDAEIEKMEEYEERASSVPVYILATLDAK
ncbi:hypothetical protein PQX77_002813 [Marasmius sp. AFHP31]|nr:hypothetical protein PQX77_002813 [Marasmius sp. AFHP31]